MNTSTNNHPTHDDHYFYLLIEREFISLKQPIYKIGRTQQYPFWKRFQTYPKGSKILLLLMVNDSIKFEKIIKKILKTTDNIIQRTDIGDEYFEASLPTIINIIQKQFQNFICDPIDSQNVDPILNNNPKINEVIHDITSQIVNQASGKIASEINRIFGPIGSHIVNNNIAQINTDYHPDKSQIINNISKISRECHHDQSKIIDHDHQSKIIDHNITKINENFCPAKPQIICHDTTEINKDYYYDKSEIYDQSAPKNHHDNHIPSLINPIKITLKINTNSNSVDGNDHNKYTNLSNAQPYFSLNNIDNSINKQTICYETPARQYRLIDGKMKNIHVCQFCDMTFTRKHDMKRHQTLRCHAAINATLLNNKSNQT